MRHRIEDLGRIAVMLENVLDLDIYRNMRCSHIRNKDFPEHWEALTQEKKDELAWELFSGINRVKEELAEILSVAWGTDTYNDIETYDL